MRYDHLRVVATALPLVLAAPGIGLGQPVSAPSSAEAQAALAPAPAQIVYSQAQLDQMLAPIALYPDQLLLEALMAATFPQQLIDAQQWLQDPNNAGLKGDALVAALQPLPWDPSVKSLVAFPQLVAMLTGHLDWTEALGTAFASQQVAVMARVQFLRGRAARAGRLASTRQLRVVHRASEIIIEPANPDVVYVPVYNPAEVYGEWPDRDAPPVYIPPPPDFYSGPVGAVIGFSVGLAVAQPLWGWGHPDWRRHEVVVDPRRYERITNVTNITNNNTVIRNDTWHRTAPVAPVPAARRPQPPAAAVNAPRPAGTVASTAVVAPKPAPAPAGQARPGTPTPATAAHPPAVQPNQPAPTAPAAAVHPPAAQPNHATPTAPAAAVHPPAAQPNHATPTAPAAAVHPPAAAHPAPHPAAPAAAVHPPAETHPAPHPAAPAAAVHPPAAPQPAPHPAAPAAAVHPPAAPQPAPHPAAPAAAVHPPAAPHPAAPAAAAHAPAKTQPPKPGEKEKEQH
jgi:hypothetical protein